ncbi:hypothetical protein D3C76_258210 [compost metagenome]
MRLMPLDPARTARLVPHNRRRVWHGQHQRIGLTNVQRYRRCRFQLNVTHIEHQWLQNAGMPRQIRRGRQFGQAQCRGRQPFPRARRLDLRQHLAAQTQRHADATRHAHQQEADQQFDPHLGHHFSQILRRQHLQPTGKRGQMNEQQRLVTEDQQAIGDGVAGGIQ